MKKFLIMTSFVAALFFLAQNLYGASSNCTIVSVEGATMIIDCEKARKGFAPGGKIKIKTKKVKTLEGC